MDFWDKKLIRQQLDAKLKKLHPILKVEMPSDGWIKTIRVSLGMTLEDLGKRVALDRSRVYRIEQAEVHGDVKLSTLQKMAEGLGVKFVYGFVPDTELEELVKAQAKKIASKRLNRIDHSMKLEDHGVSEKIQEKAFEDLVSQIMVEEPKNFWSK